MAITEQFGALVQHDKKLIEFGNFADVESICLQNMANQPLAEISMCLGDQVLNIVGGCSDLYLEII